VRKDEHLATVRVNDKDLVGLGIERKFLRPFELVIHRPTLAKLPLKSPIYVKDLDLDIRGV
jgi:hypothetical protein